MNRKKRAFLLAAAAGLALAGGGLVPVPAEVQKTRGVKVETIAPRPEDVSSIDGMVRAYYEVITGPAGRPREWARDRTLYIPDLRFVETGADAAGRTFAHVYSHQQYAESADAGMVKEGFDEREIHRVTQRFGNIAHVFSTYETRRTPGGPLIGRGINSIELFWDGQRWWIASAIWDDERPGSPIPKEYLP